MSATPPLEALPALPRDETGPVFKAPWEAQAFAMTLKLHEAGCFTWREWATQLGQEIARAEARGEADRGDSYYRHWLAALENLVAAKGLVASAQLAARKAAWREAARQTPHGRPIELKKPDRSGTVD